MYGAGQTLTRREWVQATFAPVAAMWALAQARAQQQQQPPAELEPLNRFPRMVHEYYLRRIRELEQKRLERFARIRTRADAEAYVREVREKIRLCFGPLPERTPLNPRITGTVERDAYRIEKVIFESRPGFLVTANLYIPKGRQFPLPGVVASCGHSDNGKAYEAYQAFSQGLARMGYVVLIFDPIGQGERLQYLDEQLKPRLRPGTREHLHAGNQQFLVGEFFGTWRAWDGIRALDYLLTRKEVDPERVGVAGNSGGGTMTTWLVGLDQRWAMAAPSCFVTMFRRNFENELPADTEQCPPRALALGLEHEDFLAALAPKPIIILAKEGDYFDVRGSEEAYERLRHLYRLLGAEDNIALFVGPGGHGITKESREALYRWFNRATGVSDLREEPPLQIEKDETLWCTPQGQVARLGSRTVFSFTRDKSQQLARRRVGLEGAALRKQVIELLRLPARKFPPPFRILRPLPARGYPLPNAVTYLVETEPGITIAVYRLSKQRVLSRPPQGEASAILYVSHRSADRELREEPLLRELIAREPDAILYACDVRGVGESQPDTCDWRSFDNPYGNDYFYAIHGLMLDYPYVGQKTHDVLVVLDWLSSCGYRQIHLVARGRGAIPAAFAALISPYVSKVTLKNALRSFSEVAESEMYSWPLSCFVPNVLAHFDLPDVYRELQAKGLELLDPWGANPEGM